MRRVPATTPSFELSYVLMRLRRFCTTKISTCSWTGRRKAYSRKALHIFSRPTDFSFSLLSYTCDLHSISFSRDAIQENRVFCAGIKMRRHFIRWLISISNANASPLRLKKDATKGSKGMRILWHWVFDASHFATPYPIYPLGCSKPGECYALS